MRILLSLFIFSFLFVAVFADAALIRRGGRATISNNSATILLMVPEDQVVGSDSSNLKLPNDMSIPSANSVTMEAGTERIYTTDNSCFTLVGNSRQLDTFNASNQLCYWEFSQGEALNMFGFMDHYIPGALSHSVTWEIASPTYSKTFSGPSSTIGNNPSSSSIVRDIFLNADAPDDLVPGTYEVFATSVQTAIDGYVFFEYAWVNIFGINCDINNGPGTEPFCLLGGKSFGTSYSRTSTPTRLVITQVSEPMALTSAALLLVLFFRRRFHQLTAP
jgi:hypothetical protein